jgi:hypothetical protein
VGLLSAPHQRLVERDKRGAGQPTDQVQRICEIQTFRNKIDGPCDRRFATADGTMIDVYQAPTQITDESRQQEPNMINSLLDQALGPAGYNGAFTAKMHPDAEDSPAGVIVAAAQAHGVPMISARQMLQWLDGRNASSFKALRWDRQALSFTINPASGAVDIDAMLPLLSSSGALSGFTRNGNPVSYTTETIKGFEYAFFPALAGNYTAQYNVRTPTMLTVSPARANLQASQVQRFTLLRNGAPLPIPNVTWTISPPIGSVSAAGIYTAPPAIPGIRPVTLTATSSADGAQIAAATIVLMKQDRRRSPPPLFRLVSRLFSVVSWEIHKVLSAGRRPRARRASPARNT